VGGAVEFRVGTASWTDPTLVNSDLFYPASVRSAEERLRFYAEQFNTVEVDSPFYALPSERNAKLWAERTPEGFIFNIKPFALMTQHPAEVSRLPKQLREMVPAQERSNRQLTRPSKEVVDTAFQMFWSAMAPLRQAGKLGMLAFQFPPYFIPKPANLHYLEPSRTVAGSLDRKSSGIRAGFETKLSEPRPWNSFDRTSSTTPRSSDARRSLTTFLSVGLNPKRKPSVPAFRM
jgi:uncharacterized protein YecE (DUF72 family)